jgi:hypothetical protein
LTAASLISLGPESYVPRRIAAGDFDQDGDLDLVTLNEAVATFRFYWNLGGRRFGEDEEVVVKDEGTFVQGADIVVLDYDHDGDLDIALVHAETSEENRVKITVLFNEGQREFTPRRVRRLERYAAGSITTADMDGDGKLEILASAAGGAGEQGRWTLSTLRVDAAGSLEPIYELQGHAGYFLDLNPVDMDSDGDLDLVMPSSDSAEIFLNDGTGRLGELTAYNVDQQPIVTAASDFNGDGRMDLAVSCHQFAKVAVLLNEADGGPGSGPVGAFRRGDIDASGSSEVLEDALHVLIYLFEGGAQLACLKAADVDDDGQVALSDAVYLLNYYFLGGPSPPEPFACCGLDPTPDSLPECRTANWDCR